VPNLLRIGDLAVWEWPGADPPILFLHATGFHGRLWDRIVERIPGRRAIAPDLRGHGRSAGAQPPCHWPPFGMDVIGVIDRLGLRGLTGVGHSMGGYLVVQAAAVRPEAFRDLVLVDPTIFAPDYYGKPPFDVSFVRRRRNHWNSADEMDHRFFNRQPFHDWQPGILRDYCDYGLLAAGDGFVLACRPEVEASIYECSHEAETDLHPLLAAIEHPVTILRAGKAPRPGVFDLSTSPTTPDLVTRFPNAREILLAGRNHYIPMEAPELVVAAISDRTAPSAEAALPGRPPGKSVPSR
jgi:pimeloyl-ACP methyl ester carboxylesterase